MTQESQQGHVEEPAGHTPAPRTIMLWVALVCVVVVIVSLGLASHKAGVPTVTPGKKFPSASETALNTLNGRLQALPIIAHRKASTRQADAKG
jgi:hypothetical protein